MDARDGFHFIITHSLVSAAGDGFGYVWDLSQVKVQPEPQ